MIVKKKKCESYQHSPYFKGEKRNLNELFTKVHQSHIKRWK